MRFLIVAERELRTAARRKATYVIRWTSGLGFFVLFIWLMWFTDALTSRGHIHEVFTSFSVVVFFYCLLVGAIRTADCISAERREGTLGLLFLTNLNSPEIIAGKLFSNALPAVYGLLAIFPLLAFPILMGGVTIAEFGRMLLAILDAILLALACGISASVVCKRQFPAVAAAVGMALLLGTIPFAVAGIVDEFKGPAWFVNAASVICPLYSVCVADGGKLFNANHYWLSVGCVAVLALVMLANATMRLAVSWQDRVKAAKAKAKAPTGAPPETEGWFAARKRAGRDRLRRVLLDRNAFYWLTARRSPSAPVFMLIYFVLMLVTQYAIVPAFISSFGTQRYAVGLGSMLGWVWTGLAVHLMVLYYAAMIAANSLAEDKQSGALELIFATPLPERSIHRGLWRAFLRRMIFPAFAASFVHGVFIWQVLSMMLFDPGPRLFPRGTTQWEAFWHSLLNVPFGTVHVEWEFVLMMRVLVGILVFAFLFWITLGFVGRWLGLRMKHPGFAPLVALALLVIPPTLLYSLFCFIADQSHWLNGNARRWLPMMFLTAFAVAGVHCFILCSWARRRLHEQFRAMVVGRFDVTRRTWAERGKRVAIFSLRTAGFAAAMACLVFGYYGCRDYNSRRNWENFQADLKRKNISLAIAPLFPPPAPEGDNFVTSASFRALLTKTNEPLRILLDRLPMDGSQVSNLPDAWTWVNRRRAPLGTFNNWLRTNSSRTVSANRNRNRYVNVPPPTADEEEDESGTETNSLPAPDALLRALQRGSNTLDGIAAAARRAQFQSSTNRTLAELFKFPGPEVNRLVQVHFVFSIRATANLETGDTARAAEDFHTSLELLRLARQSPDLQSQSRSQELLLRSLQPLWEGLIRHRWNDGQLASFETALAPMNVLADYTNAVRRAVLAHVELCQQLPGMNGHTSDWASEVASSYEARNAPRSWWLESGVLIHRLGETTLTNVDAGSGRIVGWLDWRDTSELPLAGRTAELFRMNIMNWSSPSSQSLPFTQTALNQARAAIALERHRLANGKYPATMNELVPSRLKALPVDVEVGRPLSYEWKTNDTFLIRGVGQNRRFDLTNSYSDDWIWGWPTNVVRAKK